jgi:hypothetical protein
MSCGAPIAMRLRPFQPEDSINYLRLLKTEPVQRSSTLERDQFSVLQEYRHPFLDDCSLEFRIGFLIA